jgi:hypothetical protein
MSETIILGFILVFMGATVLQLLGINDIVKELREIAKALKEREQNDRE